MTAANERPSGKSDGKSGHRTDVEGNVRPVDGTPERDVDDHEIGHGFGADR